MKNTNIFNETDYQLILKAQSYDNFAIELLCKRYKGLIFKYAHMQHLHSVVTDVESELWIAFIKAIHAYDTERSVPPAGYFNACIKYAQWNIFKKYRRQWAHECFDYSHKEDSNSVIETANFALLEFGGEEAHSTMLYADYNLEERVLDDMMQKAMHKQLHFHIKNLPVADQKLLYYHYVEKLSFAEIGKRFKVSKQRISYRHQQILKNLMACLH